MKKKLKIVAGIQARMGSKRLPDKMMKTLVGKTMLEHIFDRLKKSNEIDEIVLATTVEPKDDALVEIAKQNNISFFRGDEVDVLGRLYSTLQYVQGDALIRLTGDNPLIDPHIIDVLVKEYRKRVNEISFATTCLPLTYPEGYSMELISKNAFANLDRVLKTLTERETFAIFISRAEKEFPRFNLSYKKDVSDIRLTIDYKEDFEVAQKLFEHFKDKPDFELEDILQFFEEHPEVKAINQHRIYRNKYPFSLGDEAIQKAR
jgi:spore coat polysaccharide biosynthesis protein SpsF (cytidylyltransferase family)